MPGKSSQIVDFHAATETFTISRTFDAPRDLMFAVWTEPEHLRRWWGPKGFVVKQATCDLRPGGLFHYCLQAPDGSDIWGKFLFRKIVKPKLLEYINSFSNAKGETVRHPMQEQWPLELLSIVTFSEANARTTVTVKWRPLEAAKLERKAFADGAPSMKQGWTGTFDQLETYLATQKAGA